MMLILKLEHKIVLKLDGEILLRSVVVLAR